MNSNRNPKLDLPYLLNADSSRRNNRQTAGLPRTSAPPSSSTPQRFPCTQCSSTFSRHDNLLKHIQAQHGEKRDYPCKVTGCGIVCTTKGGLTKHHNRVHLKLKPYMCSKCGKGFHDKGYLNTHVKKRHPYECDSCKSTFVCQSHRKEHKCSNGNRSAAQPRNGTGTAGASSHRRASRK